MINTFLAESFLPNDFDGYINDYNIIILLTPILCRPGKYNLSSPVLVVQISTTEHVELPEDGPVTLVFSMPEVQLISRFHFK